MAIALDLIKLFFLLTAAHGYSILFIRRDPQGLKAGEQLVLRCAAGLGFLAYLTLAAAALHLLGLAFFLLALSTGNLLFWTSSRRSLPPMRRPGHLPSLAAILLGILVVVNLFYSLFPPTFYDSMLYHLAVPDLYLRSGGIVPWPSNFNASLPLTGEMLFLLALCGKALFLPKLLMFAAGLLIIVWLTSWAGSALPRRFRFLPALIFYSIPEVGFLASSSKPDVLGMLFLIVAIRLVLGYLEEPQRKGWLNGGALFFGLAVATKYIFAFYLAAFAVVLVATGRESLRVKGRILIVLGLGTLLLLAPWLAKNAVLTGNPFYPYLNKLFQTATWSQAQAENFSTLLKRGQHQDLGRYLRFPLEIFTKPYKYGITAVMGLLLLFFMPFLLAAARKLRREWRLIATALLAFFLMLPFARVPRYYLAAMMILSIPLASAVAHVSGRWPVLNSSILAALTGLFLVNGTEQVVLQERFSFGLTHVTRWLSRSSEGRAPYLYHLPYYRAAEFANRMLSDRDLVAFIGEERSFYFSRPFLASSFNDRNIAIDLLRASADKATFVSDLQARGITHILYHPRGLDALAEKSPLSRLNQEEKMRLEGFLESFTLIYRDNLYRLYRVD